MQEISANLSSPAWWFSAVVVALLINLASSYAKPWFDSRFSALGGQWKKRTEKRQREIDQKVKESAANRHVLRNNVEREARYRQQAVYMVLLGLFLLFLGPLSGMQVKPGTTVLSATFVDWLYFIIKLLGFLLVVGSIALSNIADRLEEVVVKANTRLASSEAPNPQGQTGGNGDA